MTKLVSPGLTPTTDSELTVSLGSSEPGKEDVHHHICKTEGLGDSLLNHQSCIPHHIA